MPWCPHGQQEVGGVFRDENLHFRDEILRFRNEIYGFRDDISDFGYEIYAFGFKILGIQISSLHPKCSNSSLQSKYEISTLIQNCEILKFRS